ncbi:retrovirus-related Pol polyprotein from transposon TNT 1-94 [Senna tora]|uniref:Retrovirus-related Pol polyprotein from transposon TNT 1-94 n=1 Tax=Senna tora TaxID=362788 RepID=A0A834W4G2_9FABA|nr:retrovirus-related Pol polyprotein from transposon TNT 1-94 [Senna tora]
MAVLRGYLFLIVLVVLRLVSMSEAVSAIYGNDSLNRSSFPVAFIFGASSSAYQVRSGMVVMETRVLMNIIITRACGKLTMTDGAKTANENVLPQRRTISPYDLTSLDNPGLSITQVHLKGDNYDEWARDIRTALRARKKFGFVDGTIPKPEEKSCDLEDWWTINSLLVSWIRNTIEPGLRSSISHRVCGTILRKDSLLRTDHAYSSCG